MFLTFVVTEGLGGCSTTDLRKKFYDLTPILFKPTEAYWFEDLFVKLQRYYVHFQDQLPSDRSMRLDRFFHLVASSVSPTDVMATSAAPAVFSACRGGQTSAAPTARLDRNLSFSAQPEKNVVAASVAVYSPAATGDVGSRQVSPPESPSPESPIFPGSC